jgi:hypothetical protein
MTTAEEEMKEEWCFGSLMITLMITFHCGKTKDNGIGLSKFASHCVHRGRRTPQDWKDSTHMTTDCRVASVWVLLHIQTRNKKQEQEV